MKFRFPYNEADTNEAGMRVKRRHMEVFHASMVAGSVSRAAERLNLTQPAVVLALSAFEKELGFPLFHRRSE